MRTSHPHRRTTCLLAECVLLATCLSLWGCPQQDHHLPTRYPAVVLDVPRCYDIPSPAEQKDCKDRSTDLYLNFDYLAKSDSLLWEDITALRKAAKFWRLNVDKASDGTPVAGTSNADAHWTPVSQTTVRLKLPLEVLLGAHFEFCSNDTSKQCDEDASPKIVGRQIPFLMHMFPEQPRYPAVVYDVPRCYDSPPVQQKDCKDWSTDLYLNFDYLAKSDSVLWQDITALREAAKFWRLNVDKASDGTPVAGTSNADAHWTPVSQTTARLKLPLEVLLGAYFEFCSNDTSKQCDEDASSKIVGRQIPFLMHKFPEKETPPTVEKK